MISFFSSGKIVSTLPLTHVMFVRPDVDRVEVEEEEVEVEVEEDGKEI